MQIKRYEIYSECKKRSGKELGKGEDEIKMGSQGQCSVGADENKISIITI